MNFAELEGVFASKAELAALLAFTGSADSEALAGIGISIDGGAIVAQSSNGSAALYGHGAALSKDGTPYVGSHEWQIDKETVAAACKLAGPADEVLLRVDAKGRMVRAIVKNIESGHVVSTLEIGQRVAAQLAIPDMIATVPCVAPTDGTETIVIVAPSLLKLIPIVAKAAGSDLARIVMPKRADLPVYFEFDTASELATQGDARWVAALLPVSDFEEASCEA